MPFLRAASVQGSPDEGDRSLTPIKRAALAVTTLAVAYLATMRATGGENSAPEQLRAIAPVSARLSVHSSGDAPYHRESWISPPGHTRTVHCSTLSTLANGEIFAVWYGGRREGATDVAVYTSRWSDPTKAWSPPIRVVDQSSAEQELGRPIKKIGNAVVFPDQYGTLWMVYVSVMVGGWSGCTLNVKTSTDQGQTWSDSQRLNLNPFLNLSTLVRSKPIYATDGRIGLPVYHEMALKYPQMLWLTPAPDGTMSHYQLRSLPTQSDLIQPVLVPLGQDRVLMVLRDGGPDRVLHTAYSGDNGWTWSEPGHSNLPNPDSAVDALRLRDGRVLLVYNDAEHGRETLRLAISKDDGHSWSPGPVLEHEALKEFSYPSMIEDATGKIHVTYTWKRQRIKHVEFNLAWLDQAAPHQAVALR